MHRIAVVASHVIQYQAPFFRLLAEHPDLHVDVIFCSTDGARTYRDPEMQTTFQWDLDLLGGYDHRFLRNFGFGDGYTRLINPGIVPALLFGRYDAVLFFLGWGTITSLLGIAAARMRGLPTMLFGDSSFPPPARSATSQLRAGFLRTIFGLTDRFLVSGVLNAEYYEHYGADPKHFHLVPWAIDNARFATSSTEAERQALRARYGIRDDQMGIVFSAKFLPRKDPMTLLRAVDAMHHRDRAVLIFLGNGELRAEMERFAERHGIATIFPGFINQTDLPLYYGMGDVFVLPSLDDPRGSVVNEAMAVGLPVVITDRCGSSGDIAKHGDNGFIFSPGDVQTLARHLDALAADPELRARMGRRSREIIATWDYSRGVEGVLAALRSL